MKKSVLTLMFVALTALLSGPWYATSQTVSLATCTIRGTETDDVLNGTRDFDVLCGLQGNDYVHGDGRRDRVKGGQGDDVLVGGSGRDSFRAGGGDDRVFTVDHRGGEDVQGGPGDDQCFVDRGDRVSGCEEVFIGTSIEVIRSMTRTILQVMIIANEPSPTLTTSPPMPPPVPTVTTGPTGPHCTPPPASPPPPCL